jgi:hypothetical protein
MLADALENIDEVGVRNCSGSFPSSGISANRTRGTTCRGTKALAEVEHDLRTGGRGCLQDADIGEKLLQYWAPAHGAGSRCSRSAAHQSLPHKSKFAPSPRRIICSPCQSDPWRAASRILPRAHLCVTEFLRTTAAKGLDLPDHGESGPPPADGTQSALAAFAFSFTASIWAFALSLHAC